MKTELLNTKRRRSARPEGEWSRSYLREVYEHAATVRNGDVFTTVNELTDQQPALRPEVLREAVNRLVELGEFHGDKLLTEEDKGAVLAGSVALQVDKPLAVARWYPYGLGATGGVRVSMRSEYREGDLYLNGIEPGDHITIIEDTISSGGTILALIEAVRGAGAEVTEVLAVVEKLDYSGVDRVYKATGIRVKTALGIRINHTTGCVVVERDALSEASK